MNAHVVVSFLPSTTLRRALLIALAGLPVGLGACGGSGHAKPGALAPTGQPSGGDIQQGHRGGALTVLAGSDLDSPDPGTTNEQFSEQVFLDVDRMLYAYAPPHYDMPVPDLADGPPTISADRRTVTVHLRSGVRFSPPVGRAVTARDIKYAIERDFTAAVGNSYVSGYFGALVGAPTGQPGAYRAIPGIQTPDDRTVVFHLTNPLGATLAGALVLPGTAPVPQEYAAKYDRQPQSTYASAQVATGPYMFKADPSGKVTGYSPGRELLLVRNPSWDGSTDFRKAYVDSVDIQEGLTNSDAATEKVVNGTSLIDGNVAPTPEELKALVGGRHAGQLAFAPATGTRYIALNTTIKPLDDLNVRRAILAGFDRDAVRLARGGPILGPVATHFIPPEFPGGVQAGGARGSGFDFLAAPGGDPNVAARYWRAAGYAAGRYTGHARLLMVGDSDGAAARAALNVRSQFEHMGFTVDYRAVPEDVMYRRFCTLPKAAVAVCPSVSYARDFLDPYTLLELPFDGRQILANGNSNWPQLRDPHVDAALDAAARLADPTQRYKAFAGVDRMITADAPAIPWLWDRTALPRSADVVSVPNGFTSSWDLAFTSVR